MFHFGDAEELANNFRESIHKHWSVPSLRYSPIDEMELVELKKFYVVAYMALKSAHRVKMPEESIAYLRQDYDEVFEELIQADPSFRERVRTKKYRYPEWPTPEYVAKYQGIYRKHFPE